MELNVLFGLSNEPTEIGRNNVLQEVKRNIGASGSAEDYQRYDRTVARLESVIGIDERLRVPDPLVAPWRKVCCLTIIGENGAIARGTGWFVGPRTLLTAGHCVYSSVLFGGWAKEVVIEPARNGDSLSFGSTSSTWFSSLQDWVLHEDPEWDIGCIQLDQPMADHIGWFEVATMIDEVQSPTAITIAGYPVDRNGGNVMYFHRSRLLRSSPTQLFYDVDTVGGQSGAPIWLDAADGGAKVVGIHAYGAAGEPDPILGVEANYGLRFTSELLITITGWLSENR